MAGTSSLRAVSLFDAFDDSAVALLDEASTSRELERNDVVFDQGDDPTELFVVEEGRIAISNRSDDGRESMVALMGPGDLFGEMGLFLSEGRTAAARALEPSRVLAVPYAPVKVAFEHRPELLWGVVQLLAGRLRDTDEALADSVFLDVTGRTAKRLLEMAGDDEEFDLPVTQEELAGMVGASRERVNKAIASFIKLGWLSQDGDGRYRITDRDQLSIRAN
ncbi:MAG: Crp/Fnr family transcriptional regulator [Actinomycetota bacterium]